MDVVPNVDPAEGSAVPEPSAPNIVIISCPCPGTPHETDTVVLAPEVPLPLGIAASLVIARATDEAMTMGELAPIFLRFGIQRWTLVDEKGQPLPVTPETIEASLAYGSGGFEVVEAAAGLYTAALMRPLLAARQRSSQPTSKDAPTSPTNGSGSKRQTRSRPSSPTSTAGPQSVAPAS